MISNGKLALETLGIGSSGGLQKLMIDYESETIGKFDKFTVLFNPNEYSISEDATWETLKTAGHGLNASVRRQQFVKSEPRKLNIELFFDTYEAHDSTGFSLSKFVTDMVTPLNPFSSPQASSVLAHTQKVADLIAINRELHRPPICRLSWGAMQLFTGILVQLNQRFTMFMPDGTPVRATLNCTFVEFTGKTRLLAKEPHSTDLTKVRTVQGHDTLQSIAAEVYGDSTLWRHIADRNGIINPRKLESGTQLIIPPLDD